MVGKLARFGTRGIVGCAKRKQGTVLTDHQTNWRIIQHGALRGNGRKF
ncbi:hypothetical protein FAES_0321 [Fibrella aestuarina BUZ 2]|uniref:Uncharacterized protein n=1 Tax=Fibrella aestuarina BUZ 2 TaxID=1166018 RepID=I0K2I2_9BACT|nr:hypothetical protein FAES_0321 [Fibrella aestuarina BUZ 2]